MLIKIASIKLEQITTRNPAISTKDHFKFVKIQQKQAQVKRLEQAEQQNPQIPKPQSNPASISTIKTTSDIQSNQELAQTTQNWENQVR